MIASREVDRLRASIVSELQDGVEREITLMSFVRDGCILIDQKQQQLLTLLRDGQAIVRQAVPFNRLLYSALVRSGQVVARYQHSDPLLVDYVGQALSQEQQSAACARLQHGHGIRIVSGVKGQGAVCLVLATEQDARDWHARTGVIIRRNSEAAASIRAQHTQARAAQPPLRPAAESVAGEQPEGPFEDQALLQALESALPDWLGEQPYIIVPRHHVFVPARQGVAELCTEFHQKP
jgi:hypothetical protein